MMRFVSFFAVSLFILAAIGCQYIRSCAPKTPSDEISTAIDSQALIIDVRTPSEYSGGHVKGAINIPYTQIGAEIGRYTNDKNQKLLLYCRSGRRAGIALKTLNELGYNNVVNVGGYEEATKLF